MTTWILNFYQDATETLYIHLWVRIGQGRIEIVVPKSSANVSITLDLEPIKNTFVFLLPEESETEKFFLA